MAPEVGAGGAATGAGAAEASAASAGLVEDPSGVVLTGGLELPHAAAAMRANAPETATAPRDRCDMRAAYRT